MKEQDMKALKLVFGVYTLQKIVIEDTKLDSFSLSTRSKSSFIQERLIGVFDSRDKAVEFANDSDFLKACELQNKQVSIFPFVWDVTCA